MKLTTPVITSAALLLSLTVTLPPVRAQMEPDKKVSAIGQWEISTALYGVGCVARLGYGDGDELSISGERLDRLKLLITVNSKWFSARLDGSEEDLPSIEVALVNNRWGSVQPEVDPGNRTKR
jgi:hypothetical protein